jgi:hypothetical protein
MGSRGARLPLGAWFAREPNAVDGIPYDASLSPRCVSRILSKMGLVLLGGLALSLLGGIYPLAAWKLTREREPWCTLCLGVGLAVTVFGIGYLAGAPAPWSRAVFLGSVVAGAHASHARRGPTATQPAASP